MGEEKRITVQRGGKLIVDGGKITNLCPDARWAGIEVLGSPTFSQFVTNKHGVVELKNGATIELAEIGVSLHRRNPYTLGGGILQATDADFLNNQRAISFWDYENFAPISSGPYWSNLSEIDGCTFIVNDEFPASEFIVPEFYDHIALIEVRGISIRNSIFKDERTTSINTPGGYPLGFGIYTSNGGFTANGCWFEDMVYGVNANNISSTYNYSILNSFFLGNYTGIHSRGVDNFRIRKNEFKVGGFSRAVSGITDINTQAGVFIDHGTGFDVRENKFEVNAAATQNIGICAKNTNVALYTDEALNDYNEIFLNQYDELDAGNLANGVNQAGFTGLTYLCNQNGEDVDNGFDFAVVDGTISSFQASPNGFEAAGNTFTLDPSCATPFRHIDNSDNDANALFYFYFAGGLNEEPLCVPPFKVQTISADENECSTGGIEEEPHDPDKRRQLIGKVLSEREQFDLLYQQYRDLLNGGNTQSVSTQLDNLTAQNATTVINNLESIPPYLSGEILRRVVEEPLLSNHQKLQVLKLNPEELRREYNWTYIEDNSIFTVTQLDTLWQARQQSSARGTLEQDLAASRGRLNQGANVLIAYYLSDTTDMDSVRYWSGIKRSLEGSLQVVDIYLEQQNTTAALQQLQSIEQEYGIVPGNQPEYDQFKALSLLHIDLINQNKGWHELDEPQLETLENIALQDETLAGVRAQNVLNGLYGAGLYHEPIMPGGAQPMQSLPENNTPDPLLSVAKQHITAFPNPAGSIVNFRYRLPDGVGSADLQIRNLQGKVIERQVLLAGTYTTAWHAAGHPDGVYLYTLLLPDGTVETQRVVILK